MTVLPPKKRVYPTNQWTYQKSSQKLFSLDLSKIFGRQKSALKQLNLCISLFIYFHRFFYIEFLLILNLIWYVRQQLTVRSVGQVGSPLGPGAPTVQKWAERRCELSLGGVRWLLSDLYPRSYWLPICVWPFLFLYPFFAYIIW